MRILKRSRISIEKESILSKNLINLPEYKGASLAELVGEKPGKRIQNCTGNMIEEVHGSHLKEIQTVDLQPWRVNGKECSHPKPL
ncbi:MAG: hypothetical protein ACD_37C00288G0001 [uncultured bacterium]|nr:MAG: hypothetical protein ACD_37C00288G0001 [uncultured bacterium]